MNIFIEIKHIIVGWRNWLFKKNTALAKNRLAICARCEKRETFGGKAICSLCGCFLNQKTRVKDEKCLMNKWNE